MLRPRWGARGRSVIGGTGTGTGTGTGGHTHRKPFCQNFCHRNKDTEKRVLKSSSTTRRGTLWEDEDVDSQTADRNLSNERRVLALWDCLSNIFQNEIDSPASSKGRLQLLELFFTPAYDMTAVDHDNYRYAPFGLARKLMWLACVAGEKEVVQEIIQWHSKYTKQLRPSSADLGAGGADSTPKERLQNRMRDGVRTSLCLTP